MIHWSDSHNECDYIDEETGEKKGCGVLINSVQENQCEDCRLADWKARQAA